MSNCYIVKNLDSYKIPVKWEKYDFSENSINLNLSPESLVGFCGDSYDIDKNALYSIEIYGDCNDGMCKLMLPPSSCPCYNIVNYTRFIQTVTYRNCGYINNQFFQITPNQSRKICSSIVPTGNGISVENI